MTSRPDTLRVFAPAKINLFLHVGDKRADGFHTLESLVVFADVGDTLRLAPSDRLSLSIEGPFAKGLEGEGDNLILRAAHALMALGGGAKGADMVLEKALPVSSGIGGGSADAAAALRGLIELWKLDIAPRELHALAAKLGSDVPVCLASSSAWMEGRGERVEPAGAVPSMAMVLINPGVAVPTGKVFAGLGERCGLGVSKPAQWASQDHLIAYLKTTGNDLQAPACAIAPEIGAVLEALEQCDGIALARMSGSGATCFGLFKDENDAVNAAQRTRRSHAEWWVTQTTIAG